MMITNENCVMAFLKKMDKKYYSLVIKSDKTV